MKPLFAISWTIYLFMYLMAFMALSYVFCKHALQMFQQNRYELYRYSKWLFNRNNLRLSHPFIYIVVIFLVCTLFRKDNEIIVIFVTIIYAVWLLKKEEKKQYIKDLVLTARVKRQIAVMIVLLGIFLGACFQVFSLDITGTLTVIMPYLLIYPMALITQPFEELIKKHYENEARSILDKMDSLIKIGITGSYGKTSTKNIIADIIADDMYTLITPASYNTPMGITRTVREQLKPVHEVFVCEMGADKVGDISYLMDFVKPQYGIVTSIGPQHLATFGSIENIVHEKMQEVEMLPESGTAFINIDNEYINSYEIKNTCEVITVGLKNKKADYFAEDIEYSKEGSKFSVSIAGKKYRFQTSLLGEHNVTNILIGIALARKLGLDMKQIMKNVKAIRQVEHRLEVKKLNGYTFIDDAFNSNPVGSKMALDVLSMMPGKRVIVTPGMIDLGEKQDELNKEFGAYIKDRADHVILVGERQTKAILEGLRETGFPEENIMVFANIREALDHVYRNFSSKDTILLENDLPDAFNV